MEAKFIAANGKIRIMKTPRDFERNDMYVAEAKDFIRCIRQGRRPAVDGEAGRTVLEMAIAAKEASRRQRAVRLL